MKQKMIAFLRDEEGLTMVEYAVAGGLITAGAVLAFTTLGGHVTRVIGIINTALAAIV
jgi:pilus assembly protein Flp/PilA